jgi:hypothetical protein
MDTKPQNSIFIGCDVNEANQDGITPSRHVVELEEVKRSFHTW